MPTPDVSLVDLVVVTEKPVTAELANQKLRDAAQGPLNGVLRYCDEPLVSSDFMLAMPTAVLWTAP
ncbi:MAG: hypothetical protein R2857_06110 [Vampirovibrionales bacterium]